MDPTAGVDQGVESDPLHCDELGRMVDEISEFLVRHVDRLEARLALPVGKEGMVDGNMQAAVDAFEQERVSWQTEKHEEAQRLRSEAQLLQEAWSRLEDEQRRLLAERELVRRSRTSDGGVQLAAPTSDSSPGQPSTDPSDGTDPAEHRTAWLQFQRMRREMQAHSNSRL